MVVALEKVENGHVSAFLYDIQEMLDLAKDKVKEKFITTYTNQRSL